MTVSLVVDAFDRSFRLHPRSTDRLSLHSVKSYLPLTSLHGGKEHSIHPVPSDEPFVHIDAQVDVDGQLSTIRGRGQGTIGAFGDALRSHLALTLVVQESSVQTVDGKGIIAILEVYESSRNMTVWGIGMSEDHDESRCRALVSAANTIMNAGEAFPRQTKASWLPYMVPGYTLPLNGYFPCIIA